MNIETQFYKIGLILPLLTICICSNGQKNKKKNVDQESIPAKTESSWKEIELTKEVDAPKGATVRIVCSNQNLEVRRGTDNKVKLTTKINIDKTNVESNDQLFEKYGITIHSLNNRIDISARENEGHTFYYNSQNDPKKFEYEFYMNGNNLPRIDKLRSEDVARLRKQKQELAIRNSKDRQRIQEDIIKMKRDLARIDRNKGDKSQYRELQDYEKLNNLSGKKIKELAELKNFEDSKAWNESKDLIIPKVADINRMIAPLKMFGLNKISEPYLLQNFSHNFNFNSSRKNIIVIYVPADAKLDLENQFGNVNILDDYSSATINMNNGTLDARKFGTLKLISKYCNANIGDIEDGQIEFENGNFTAGNIKELDIDSKYSTVEFDNGTNMIIRSQNDNYTIESLDKLEGRKSYGTFRLNKLAKSFNLEGQNADIRIKNMTAEVDYVKLNDRYADIRLPVKDLKNYEVNFEGRYSTVFGPFEKHVSEQTNIIDKNTKDISKDLGDNNLNFFNSMAHSVKSGDNSPVNFNAIVGDTKVAHTKFNIICNNCTVDFK